jgi:hypothetical protein
MQGHGRTADIKRDMTYENLADDVAALLDFLKIPNADVIGFSMGGGVAMQCAIRHSEKVRKVVSISAVFRQNGWVKEAIDAFPKMTAENFKGTPMEAEYRRLSPTPDGFPAFVMHVLESNSKPYDFGAEKLKATKAPMFFIHGDADGVRLDHIAEMFRLKGDEIPGDMLPRSAVPGRVSIDLAVQEGPVTLQLPWPRGETGRRRLPDTPVRLAGRSSPTANLALNMPPSRCLREMSRLTTRFVKTWSNDRGRSKFVRFTSPALARSRRIRSRILPRSRIKRTPNSSVRTLSGRSPNRAPWPIARGGSMRPQTCASGA